MGWAVKCDGQSNYFTIVATSIPAGEDGSVRTIFRLSSAALYRNVFGNLANNNSIFRLVGSNLSSMLIRPESGTLHQLTYSTPLVVGDWYDFTLTKTSGVWDLIDTQTQLSVLTAPSPADDTELKIEQLFRRKAQEYFHGDVQLLKITAAITTANNRNWDATASSHAAGELTLIDTVGGNDATGVNFPTDGSAWVDLGGNTETYSFSATINATPELSGSLNKLAGALSAIIQNNQFTVSFEKNNNLSASIAQNHQQQATKTKTATLTGDLKQNYVLSAAFTSTTIEVHEFTASITLAPHTSANVSKTSDQSTQIEQPNNLSAATTKTAVITSVLSQQPNMVGEAEKESNLSGNTNQAITLNALFLNSAQPIYLHQFRINGEIVFQRFNGTIVKQQFNGEVVSQRFNGVIC